MKIAERIVMVLLLFVLIGGGAWIYFAVQYDQAEVRDAVARGEYEIRPEPEPEQDIEDIDWRTVYPNTIPIFVGDAQVQASIADSLSERIKGLSDTPFLPDNVVKLFAFGTPGAHSIWMKDMQYSLDIFWAAEDGTIVHIEENVSPDSFPTSFAAPDPVAWYVVEASAGFAATNSVEVGDMVVIPRN